MINCYRIILALAAILLSATVGYSATIHVPTDQPTIQAGINAAVNGDTVLVSDGTYTENIDYNSKSLILLSANGPEMTLLQPAIPTTSTIIISNCSGISKFIGFSVINGGVISGNGNLFISSSLDTTYIVNNIFHHNSVGSHNNNPIIKSSSLSYISRNLFYNNGGINCIWADEQSFIINNTMDSNNRGLLCLDAMTTALNNIVANSNEYGVLGDFKVLDYNDVWNNGSANNPGPNGISLDPLFNNADLNDFSLLLASPCIDAGNPETQYDDFDGTRNDIGAIAVVQIQDTPLALDFNYGSFISGDTVHTLSPEFFWRYFDDEESEQVQYQIQVGIDNDWTIAEIWDSSEIMSSDTFAVYSGDALSNNTRYYLRIRVNNGIQWGGWRAHQFFIHLIGVIHIPADQPTIQDGINSAMNGDTVLVADGVYTENINFLGKAILVTSENGSGSTFIEPQAGDVDIITFNSGEDTNSVIRGFSIRNTPDAYGIYIYNSSPIIEYCDINNCVKLEENGAGVWYWNAGGILRFNKIRDNEGSGTGGGIGGQGSPILEIAYNEIYNNDAVNGPGIGLIEPVSNKTIHHNIILNNHGTGYGTGGIFINGSNCSIYNNTIVGNTKGITLVNGLGIDIRNNCNAPHLASVF